MKPASIPSIPNASSTLSVLGNSLSFAKDPVAFLQSQRDRLGDVFLVDLMMLRIVFFLGPEGSNSIFKGTEDSGLSMYAAVGECFSETSSYRN